MKPEVYNNLIETLIDLTLDDNYEIAVAALKLQTALQKEYQFGFSSNLLDI